MLVAGPGLAPGSAGYEPTEILLLYPAIMTNTKNSSITNDVNQYFHLGKILKIRCSSRKKRKKIGVVNKYGDNVFSNSDKEMRGF